uniref:BolA-like protein 2 n=1 Tax=Chelonoidis abingdonii TaxID=106734 RepID=A0A8C0GIG6_CHEAB
MYLKSLQAEAAALGLGRLPQWGAGFSLPLLHVPPGSAQRLHLPKSQRDVEGGLEVEDTTPSRCSTSFKVLVVSSRFRGKPLLQRHRLVNELLAEDLKHIHAFEQRTLTPEQWEKERGGLQ